MIKTGDLVKYTWSDTVGIVLKVNRESLSGEIMVKVRWPDHFATRNNAGSNTWFTRLDRWLMKVEK
jgi:hypothetical protein